MNEKTERTVRRGKYEVYSRLKAIEGPMFVGTYSNALKFARLVGGRDWKKAGYRVQEVLC